jgi:hypothetical protein
MFRIIGIAALALVSGIGIGLANGASAQDSTPKTVVGATAKTPLSCLLALESAWKTIHATPTGTDEAAAFESSYAECLQAS